MNKMEQSTKPRGEATHKQRSLLRLFSIVAFRKIAESYLDAVLFYFSGSDVSRIDHSNEHELNQSGGRSNRNEADSEYSVNIVRADYDRLQRSLPNTSSIYEELDAEHSNATSTSSVMQHFHVL